MGFKSKLINVWEENVCERTNRRALKCFKKATKLWHTGNKIARFRAMCIHNRNIKKYGCEIYPQAQIGEGLYIPHCTGIVVGSTTIIGRNCVIFPNVVFGARYSPNTENNKKRRHAMVGDNCSFGANCSIIGDVTIGHDVTVGAGSVITKDIPDYAIVVGNNKIIGYKEK